MRIWVDLTNSAHVLVMRPVVRAFAQTLELCERLGVRRSRALQDRVRRDPRALARLMLSGLD